MITSTSIGDTVGSIAGPFDARADGPILTGLSAAAGPGDTASVQVAADSPGPYATVCGLQGPLPASWSPPPRGFFFRVIRTGAQTTGLNVLSNMNPANETAATLPSAVVPGPAGSISSVTQVGSGPAVVITGTPTPGAHTYLITCTTLGVLGVAAFTLTIDSGTPSAAFIPPASGTQALQGTNLVAQFGAGTYAIGPDTYGWTTSSSSATAWIDCSDANAVAVELVGSTSPADSVIFEQAIDSASTVGYSPIQLPPGRAVLVGSPALVRARRLAGATGSAGPVTQTPGAAIAPPVVTGYPTGVYSVVLTCTTLGPLGTAQFTTNINGGGASSPYVVPLSGIVTLSAPGALTTGLTAQFQPGTYASSPATTYTFSTTSLSLALSTLTASAGGGGGGTPGANLQATWYVNPQTGADTNSGTSPATALATVQQVVTRIGTQVVPQNVTVFLQGGNTDATTTFINPPLAPGVTFLVVGVRVPYTASNGLGALVSSHAWAGASQQVGEYTMGTCVGAVTALTQGRGFAANAATPTTFAPIGTDINGGGEVGEFSAAFVDASVSPPVFTEPPAASTQLYTLGNGFSNAAGLQLGNGVTLQDVTILSVATIGSALTTLIGCRVSGTVLAASGQISVYGCSLLTGGVAQASGSGSLLLACVYAIAANVFALPGGTIVVSRNSILDTSANVIVYGGARLSIGTGISLAIVNVPASPAIGLALEGPGSLVVDPGYLWTATTLVPAAGISVGPGSTIVWSTPPVVGGSPTNPWVVGTENLTQAVLAAGPGYADLATGAVAVPITGALPIGRIFQRTLALSFALGSYTAGTTTQTYNVGAPLPAGAVPLGGEINNITDLTGGGIGAAHIQLGLAGDASLAASTNIFSAPLKANGIGASYAGSSAFSGAPITAKITVDTTVGAATAGSQTITLWFMILP